MTPLILLHGIGTGPGAWGPQIEALSLEREVVAPDLVGAYASGWEAAVEEVRLLTTQHREVDLCGLSLGGLIALQIAAERSEAGERLIVCAAFRGLPPGLRRRVRAMATLTCRCRAAFCTRQLVAEIPQPYRNRALAEIAPLGPGKLARLMRHAASARIDTKSIAARALVLCGDRDEANLKLARDLASGLPGSTFALVPEAGHVANLDNAEAFTGLVAEFLAG
jgi:pimeloyl-ACP methyl ester carboxylesterase